LTPNRVTGAKIVGARAGLDDKESVAAFANAQKEFEAFSRNSGQVKDLLKVDKGFLKIADSARSSSEWIDRIIQKIRAFGDIAIRALTSPVGAAATLAAGIFGVKVAGDAAAESLAKRSSRFSRKSSGHRL